MTGWFGWAGRFLVGAVVALAGFGQPDAPASAGFSVAGTLDCGEANLEYCPVRDRIYLWTESISGVRERVMIRTEWIKEAMIYALALQDDYFVIEVQERPNGGLRALAIQEHVTQGNAHSKRDPQDDESKKKNRDKDD